MVNKLSLKQKYPRRVKMLLIFRIKQFQKLSPTTQPFSLMPPPAYANSNTTAILRKFRLLQKTKTTARGSRSTIRKALSLSLPRAPISRQKSRPSLRNSSSDCIESRPHKSCPGATMPSARNLLSLSLCPPKKEIEVVRCASVYSDAACFPEKRAHFFTARAGERARWLLSFRRSRCIRRPF